MDKPNVNQSTGLKGHAAPIEKVAFNPVKELELCSVSSDGTVKFWDVKTKSLLNEVKGLGEAFTLAWSPDGEYVIVGNKVRTNLPFDSLSPTYAPSGGQALCAVAQPRYPIIFAPAVYANQQHCFLLEWTEDLRYHGGGQNENLIISRFRASLPVRL